MWFMLEYSANECASWFMGLLKNDQICLRKYNITHSNFQVFITAVFKMVWFNNTTYYPVVYRENCFLNTTYFNRDLQVV